MEMMAITILLLFHGVRLLQASYRFNKVSACAGLLRGRKWLRLVGNRCD